MKVRYKSNNSGGSWWLTDENWEALRNAGWTIEDYDYLKAEHEQALKNDPEAFDSTRFFNGEKRYLGALASAAFKNFETPGEAMREFEKLTGLDVSDEGCNCCGAPHAFEWGRAVDDTLPEEAEYGYVSGEGCLKYLFPGKKLLKSLRQAMEDGK